MKKLLMISLSCLVLCSCGEKKVTEEMLLGDWECRLTGQEAEWKNGIFQDYSAPKSEKGLIKYFMKDNVLFSNFGLKTSYPFNLASFYNKSDDIQSIDGSNIKTQKSIEYFSQDRFKATIITEITYDDHTKDDNNIKTKVVTDCERIKK